LLKNPPFLALLAQQDMDRTAVAAAAFDMPRAVTNSGWPEAPRRTGSTQSLAPIPSNGRFAIPTTAAHRAALRKDARQGPVDRPEATRNRRRR
jgi:hypothetical protein